MPLHASVLVFLLGSPAHAILHRHDVDEAEFEIPAAEFPAVVDLLSAGDCLGTLIDPEWLLTATHCAEHLKADATFYIGGETVGMAAFYLHEDYDQTHHDIALVQLDRPIENIDPFPWYTGRDEEDQLVWFVGRGDSGTGLEGQQEAVLDGKTRWATNRIEAAEDGLISFVFYGPDEAGVTELEGISGNGDSGGPALMGREGGWVVVGISSFQDANWGQSGTYGVEEYYTRVSDHDDWIRDGMSLDLEASKPKGCAVVGRHGPSPMLWGLGFGLLALFRRD